MGMTPQSSITRIPKKHEEKMKNIQTKSINLPARPFNSVENSHPNIFSILPFNTSAVKGFTTECAENSETIPFQVKLFIRGDLRG
jgi:hypothetical protein